MPSQLRRELFNEDAAAQHLGISLDQLRDVVRRRLLSHDPMDSPLTGPLTFHHRDLVLLRFVIAQEASEQIEARVRTAAGG